jgi:hypothetical protein
MFERLRYSIGLAYTNFRLRNKQQELIQFAGSLTSAHRILMLMPETGQRTSGYQAVVEEILQRYTPQNVTLVARFDLASSLRSFSNARLITFGAQDLDNWFLPRDKLLQTVKKSTFDVAIDLNLELALPSAFLCRSSNARIRIGFEQEMADTFYNLHVRAKRQNPGEAYRQMIHTVRMF